MKLLLFSRRGVVHAADELRRTFAAIARYGFDFVVNKEFAETIRSLGVAQIPAEKEYGCNACPPVGEGAVMVCYGGDGTLLDGVRLLGGAPVPVVGINAGHMGFLTGGRKEAIEELFAEIARGTLRIEQRTMLIVSTPTGSTAYSLSAGGPVVAPGCRCLVISPLAPHNLTMRPVVVPDTSDVALRVRTRRSAVTLSLDNTAYDVADDTEIRVSLSEKRIFLGQAHNISFYDTLRDKMMWGVDIRD